MSLALLYAAYALQNDINDKCVTHLLVGCR